MLEQLQRKAEGPASAPTTQTQLSTGEVINVSKEDEQGTKYSLLACRVGDIEETPPACFQGLQYPLWVVNADLFVEYDSAGFVLKWFFDVVMLGKDLIFYGETIVVYRIARFIQRLSRIEKEKDPSEVPFYHTWLPVYSLMSGPVTTNMYQFDEHSVRVRKSHCHVFLGGLHPGQARLKTLLLMLRST